MKILIIGADPNSLINFRGDLIKDLIRSDFHVTAMSNNASIDEINKIEKLGASYKDLAIAKHGINPLTDLKTLFSLIKNLQNLQPDYIFAYTVKPVIWGGIASKFFPKMQFIGMITGQGFVFGEGGLLRRIIRSIVIILYKLALSNAKAIIFQNVDNKKLFNDLNMLPKENIYVVNGSGVNIKHFSYKEPKIDLKKIKFLMVARLLRDKGIYEFISAAERAKSLFDNVEFTLIGPEDLGPNAVDINFVLEQDRKGTISYLGSVSDIRPSIIDSTVFVLPSYHEGMPRSVLEAMAIGRPIITTDVPGCRETVIDNFNGWLVPKKNVDKLFEKIVWFINQSENIRLMGESSRKLVIKKFDVDSVNYQILDIIQN